METPRGRWPMKGAGNQISFSATNHQGSPKVYPMVIQNGKFRLIENWNIFN